MGRYSCRSSGFLRLSGRTCAMRSAIAVRWSVTWSRRGGGSGDRCLSVRDVAVHGRLGGWDVGVRCECCPGALLGAVRCYSMDAGFGEFSLRTQ